MNPAQPLTDAGEATIAREPCLSVHPILGSRCELRLPHSMCEGWRPASTERVQWETEPLAEEPPHAKRRREHPGYACPIGIDGSVEFSMARYHRSALPASDVLRRHAEKLASEARPFVPRDPDGDIPDA